MLCSTGYFRYEGRMFTPGEVIDMNINPETLEWLERSGAVKDTEEIANATDDVPEEKPARKATKKAKNPSALRAEEAAEGDPVVDIDPTESISIRKRKR